MSANYIGIDVGSYSVRAAIFKYEHGIFKFISKQENDIQVFHDETDFYEQSSDEIWQKIGLTIRNLLSQSKISPVNVSGISFDATCSLVALDKFHKPLSVSKSGDVNRNIVLWMDHRANFETSHINHSQHRLLQFTGGNIFVEMQPPKLMWLKKNIPEFIDNAGLLMDLCDFLTFKATNSTQRSLCSVTCKWAYDGLNNCWDNDFWKMCGLDELCNDNYRIIGAPDEICSPGTLIGSGLSGTAAIETGLLPGTPVFIGLIDAYAGMLGALSVPLGIGTTNVEPSESESTNKLNCIFSISGSSACHMTMMDEIAFVSGVWGPYKNVLLPKKFVFEAGQSANGLLLDHILKFNNISSNNNSSLNHDDVIPNLLNAIHANRELSDNMNDDDWIKINQLTNHIHMNPDFLGNRSPRSNPDIKGAIIGLPLSCTEIDVAILYLCTVQALAYGYREILDRLLENRTRPDSIIVSGGFTNNKIYLKCLADITGIPVTIYPDVDLVLLGAAKLCLHDTAVKVSANSRVIQPCPTLKRYHERKYNIYKELISFQTNILKITDAC